MENAYTITNNKTKESLDLDEHYMHAMCTAVYEHAQDHPRKSRLSSRDRCKKLFKLLVSKVLYQTR